jgi:hypothetical protein
MTNGIALVIRLTGIKNAAYIGRIGEVNLGIRVLNFILIFIFYLVFSLG